MTLSRCVLLRNGRTLTNLTNISTNIPMTMITRQLSGLEILGTVAAASGIASGSSLVWYNHKLNKLKIKHSIDINKPTITRTDGSHVYAKAGDSPLQSYLFEDAQTIYEAVRRGMRQSNDGQMLGRRVVKPDGTEPWEWLSYGEALSTASHLSLGFRKLGLPVGQQTFIGIWMQNRPEWMMTEMAAFNYNNVSVPLYETLGQDECLFICQQTEMSIVVCDNQEKIRILLERKDILPELDIILSVDTIPDDLKRIAIKFRVRVLGLDEVIEMGKNCTERPPHVVPSPGDICTICYTSGTTGRPKGVMLSHRNFLASTTCISFFYNNFGSHHKTVGFLPLAHVMERLVEYALFSVGGSVGYFRGDITGLLSDIQTLRPTVLPMVPRVLNKLYDAVLLEVNKSWFKKIMFQAAMAMKTYEINRSVIRSDSIADKIVFKKIRDKLGGELVAIITGSAPLSKNVLTFARCALGCSVMEAYGQTENAAAGTMTIEGDPSTGHVGVPVPCCAVKLIYPTASKDSGKEISQDAGEICIKGFNVTKGYFKNEKQTKETIDADGWLHTGDIGKWDERGQLVILDRIKNTFKLSQGEFVAPEQIEQVYLRSKFVSQCFVYGDPLKSCLIAIVVPEKETINRLASKLFLSDSFTGLCQDKRVHEAVMKDIEETASSLGLQSFEIVKAIHISPDEFTVSNGLITPTLKNKRPQLAEKYAKELFDMYSRLE